MTDDSFEAGLARAPGKEGCLFLPRLLESLEPVMNLTFMLRDENDSTCFDSMDSWDQIAQCIEYNLENIRYVKQT